MSQKNDTPLPPPIAPLMRMMEMKREVLATSQSEVNTLTTETTSEALYGPVSLEKVNLMRAEIVSKIMLDEKIARSMSKLFERYRGSF